MEQCETSKLSSLLSGKKSVDDIQSDVAISGTDLIKESVVDGEDLEKSATEDAIISIKGTDSEDEDGGDEDDDDDDDDDEDDDDEEESEDEESDDEDENSSLEADSNDDDEEENGSDEEDLNKIDAEDKKDTVADENIQSNTRLLTEKSVSTDETVCILDSSIEEINSDKIVSLNKLPDGDKADTSSKSDPSVPDVYCDNVSEIKSGENDKNLCSPDKCAVSISNDVTTGTDDKVDCHLENSCNSQVSLSELEPQDSLKTDDFTSKKSNKSIKKETKRKKKAKVDSSNNDCTDSPKSKKRKRKQEKNKNGKKRKKEDKSDSATKRYERKNIRKIIANDQLEAETRTAQQEEIERKKRLQEQKKKSENNQCLKALLESSDEDDEDDCLNEEENNLLAERMLGAPKPIQDVINISSDEDDVIMLPPEEDDDDDDVDPNNMGLHVDDTKNLPDDSGQVLVNVGHPDDDPDVFLAPQLAGVVKPHQIGGIRFLYDNLVESISRFDSSSGFGCILAHSMGLGKTIQVISFVDVFLRHTSARTVLVIVPINTLQNWIHEFNMWLPTEEMTKDLPSTSEDTLRNRNFNVHVLNDNLKTMDARAVVVELWIREGGVLLMGYEMYRLLATRKPSTKSRKPKKNAGPIVIDIEEEDRNKELAVDMQVALLSPGPDLVICDEGHRIKNSGAGISKALKQIRTRRRVVLTGYPLQNNLVEYWCMVDFVRPNFLGTKVEFSNMFERPIMNAQCFDSTNTDLKVMRERAHVLHSLLEGFVQRRGHAVLKFSLPAKQEFVIMVRMSPIQRKLYCEFMNILTLELESWASMNPLKAFSVCCKIWNHPDVLFKFLKSKNSSIDNDLDIGDINPETGKKVNGKKGRKNGRKGSNSGLVDPASRGIDPSLMSEGFFPFADKKDTVITYEWTNEYMKDYIPGLLENGGKFVVLFTLLNESMALNDKILVFSQSLMTLNLIEEFLGKQTVPLPDCTENWTKNKHYFRLDGSTSGVDREKLINSFNDPENKDIHLFLLSTKAGCLGINLIGANRVLIMDASWNPCHDCQAVCRIYRYGQIKPCFIYRLVTDNSLEQKIYQRQISKQTVADRVVDELNPQNNFTKGQVDTLLHFEDIEIPEVEPQVWSEKINDIVLCKVLDSVVTWLTKVPFTHESLLIDRKEYKLTKAEKRLARQHYEREKRKNMTYSRPSYAAYYPVLPIHAAMNSHTALMRPNPYSSNRHTLDIRSMHPSMSTPIPMQPNLRNQSQNSAIQQLQNSGVSVHQVVTTTDIIMPGSNTGSDSSAQPAKIPAGQQIMVIKTQKGVYIRTKEGRIFAVRSNKSLLDQCNASNLQTEDSSLNSAIKITPARGSVTLPATMPNLPSSLPYPSSSLSSFQQMEENRDYRQFNPNSPSFGAATMASKRCKLPGNLNQMKESQSNSRDLSSAQPKHASLSGISTKSLLDNVKTPKYKQSKGDLDLFTSMAADDFANKESRDSFDYLGSKKGNDKGESEPKVMAADSLKVAEASGANNEGGDSTLPSFKYSWPIPSNKQSNLDTISRNYSGSSLSSMTSKLDIGNTLFNEDNQGQKSMGSNIVLSRSDFNTMGTDSTPLPSISQKTVALSENNHGSSESAVESNSTLPSAVPYEPLPIGGEVSQRGRSRGRPRGSRGRGRGIAPAERGGRQPKVKAPGAGRGGRRKKNQDLMQPPNSEKGMGAPYTAMSGLEMPFPSVKSMDPTLQTGPVNSNSAVSAQYYDSYSNVGDFRGDFQMEAAANNEFNRLPEYQSELGLSESNVNVNDQPIQLPPSKQRTYNNKHNKVVSSGVTENRAIGDRQSNFQYHNSFQGSLPASQSMGTNSQNLVGSSGFHGENISSLNQQGMGYANYSGYGQNISDNSGSWSQESIQKNLFTNSAAIQRQTSSSQNSLDGIDSENFIDTINFLDDLTQDSDSQGDGQPGGTLGTNKLPSTTAGNQSPFVSKSSKSAAAADVSQQQQHQQQQQQQQQQYTSPWQNSLYSSSAWGGGLPGMNTFNSKDHQSYPSYSDMSDFSHYGMFNQQRGQSSSNNFMTPFPQSSQASEGGNASAVMSMFSPMNSTPSPAYLQNQSFSSTSANSSYTNPGNPGNPFQNLYNMQPPQGWNEQMNQLKESLYGQSYTVNKNSKL